MSLADLSAQIRAALKWLLILPVVIFILWLSWLVAKQVSSGLFSPRGAETAYGNLAPPLFTKTFFSLKVNDFELDTTLPKKQDKADVFVTEVVSNFSSEKQKEIISFFGLNYAEKTKEGNVTIWKSNVAILTFDSSKGTFGYHLDLSKDTSVIQSNLGLDQNQAAKKAEEIVKKLVSSPKDIDKNNPVVRFLKLSTERQEETTSSSANAVEVSFYRKVGSLRSSGGPLIRLLLSEGGNRTLEFDYNYYSIDPEASAYPIIDGGRAWEELQEGKAFTETSQEFSFVKVTKIYLSYWESKFREPYLQPIWVFTIKGKSSKGEKEFEAYLPAVNPSFFWGEESPP